MSESEFMLLDVDYSRRSRNQFLIRVLVIGFAFILGFVIISLIISSNTPSILKRPKFKTQCSTDYDYDYDLLTLRWPPSICGGNDCPKYPNNTWVIHGLWPTFNNNSWPQFCCFDRHFHIEQLEPIKTQMETYWPNLEEGRGEDSLWQHEWQKHGTCTKTKQIDYFNSTLSLFKMFQIYEWLKESNILPSNEKTYEVSDIKKVLSNKLGHSVLITCPSSRSETVENTGKAHTIKEIRICISRNTSQVIDCSEESECKQQFLYPISPQK